MACPYFSSPRSALRTSSMTEETKQQEGYNSIQSENDLDYSSYLQLDKILDAQQPRSGLNGRIPIHDEHLFIVTHQAFELWFKQILHEINSIRNIFISEYLEERNSLCVISRINRVVSIMKLCAEQFRILETMTPQDFLDFRDDLASGSGFQSFQFRMIEIRLGIANDLRVMYNKSHFLDVFFGEKRKKLEKAMTEPSLLNLVNDWLARTPGLKLQTFNFWGKFKVSVEAMLEEMKVTADEEEDLEMKKHKMSGYQSRARSFQSIFDETIHNDLFSKNERRLSHQAMQGALMIFCYRDEPRFHLPFQVLHALTDVDNQLMKFRYYHTSMVQRMVGAKVGTGGSSGYHYLRSTCSDRYKVFIDLVNMATYLVPRDRIPPLTSQMKSRLSMHGVDVSQLPYVGEEKDSGYQACSVQSFPYIAEDDEGSEVGSSVGGKEGKLETVL